MFKKQLSKMLKVQIQVCFSIEDDLHGGTGMASRELLIGDRNYELKVRCESFHGHENGNSLVDM